MGGHDEDQRGAGHGIAHWAHPDKNLAVDEPSLDYIRAYAADQDKFFADFSKVYVKMTTMGAKFA